MKVSLEILLLGYVTAVCSVIAMALMFKQLWPVFLVALVVHYIYRHYHPKNPIPRKVPKEWIDQDQ